MTLVLGIASVVLIGVLYHRSTAARPHAKPSESISGLQRTGIPPGELYSLMHSARRRGRDDAPVMVVEVIGSCPGCATVDSLLSALSARFPDLTAVVRLRFADVDAPADAVRLSALDCALDYHLATALLRDGETSSTRPDWRAIANSASDSVAAAFAQCAAATSMDTSLVRTETATALTWGVAQPPEVFINGKAVPHPITAQRLDSLVIGALGRHLPT